METFPNHQGHQEIDQEKVKKNERLLDAYSFFIEQKRGPLQEGEVLSITERELNFLYLRATKEEDALRLLNKKLPHISPDELRHFLIQEKGLQIKAEQEKVVRRWRSTTQAIQASPTHKTRLPHTKEAGTKEPSTYSTKLAQYGDDTLKD
ncbi:MAG: hypothetical protein RLZZ308_110 [Candidatus Parcubacteria bacterium]|jgi:hypothetical protein